MYMRMYIHLIPQVWVKTLQWTSMCTATYIHVLS